MLGIKGLFLARDLNIHFYVFWRKLSYLWIKIKGPSTSCKIFVIFGWVSWFFFASLFVSKEAIGQQISWLIWVWKSLRLCRLQILVNEKQDNKWSTLLSFKLSTFLRIIWYFHFLVVEYFLCIKLLINWWVSRHVTNVKLRIIRHIITQEHQKLRGLSFSLRSRAKTGGKYFTSEKELQVL